MSILNISDPREFAANWAAQSADDMMALGREDMAAGMRRYREIGEAEPLSRRPSMDDPEGEYKPRLISPLAYESEIRQLWVDGFPAGDKTGWIELDKHYTVMPGLFTVLTGWPGAGKSEWLDALLVNLARQ